MISTQELIYRFKLEYDKLDSNDNPDIEIPKIILLLNKAILLYVKECYGLNNGYKLGFEGNQERLDDLQMLVVKDEPFINYTAVPDSRSEYVADISNLVKGEYLDLVSSYSLANKDKCENRVIANIQVTHDDINEVLKDDNRKPSFEWQELPITIAQDKIWAYTDSTFEPTKLHIDYLKFPTKVDYAGYIGFDGNSSSTIDSELPDYALLTIVDIAVKIAQGIIKDTEGYQISQANLQIEQ